jgi:hypothetical protein
VARYTVSSENPNIAAPESAVPILTLLQPLQEHNGNHLQFSPRDGYLYIGIGDGGAGGDPENNAQNPAVLLGKLLRLDVDSGFPYAIPPHNPFVGPEDPLDEIWAHGLRNPWRFAFDRATGDLYIADVGEDEWEEINFQGAESPGGENYGWRIVEGTKCFDPSLECDQVGYTPPIHAYNHAQGCAVIGGYVYRGLQLPALAGTLLFGDYCAYTIWGLWQSLPGTWMPTALLKVDFVLSSFGEDEAGEIYITDYHGGRVLALAAVPLRLGGVIDGVSGQVFCSRRFLPGKRQGLLHALSWSCDHLRAASGTRVEVTFEGQATSRTISGLVAGLEVTEVNCTNQTRRKSAPGTGASPWGCGDLSIAAGDKIRVRLRGKVS